MKTVVWTDGSCNAKGRHGRGGWAALIEQAGTFGEISGSADDTTHNRMELTAICVELETLTGAIDGKGGNLFVGGSFNGVAVSCPGCAGCDQPQNGNVL